MRYIGNKTRLLGFIRDVLEKRGATTGTAVDPFTGTASVARALKTMGFRVIASDLMDYAYVFARAYVQPDGPPDLTRLAADLGIRSASLAGVTRRLAELEPKPGFLYEHFTPAGEDGCRHGRMYFTPENAARIDSLRDSLDEWRAGGVIDDEAFFVLLATLLEGADRVANTTGVYASFVKTWQPNAMGALRLKAPSIAAGAGSVALRADALRLVRDLEPFELLYLDPPYNARQYPAYYHVPEIIARGWSDGGPPLRGKTGLLPDEHQRSDWCRRGDCENALAELLAAARCRHIVLSYNTEGIIPESAIERIMKEHGRAGTFRRYRYKYKRYRSDSDGARRNYQRDSVEERLYCVSR